MTDLHARIHEAELAVRTAQEELRKLRAEIQPEEVANHVFSGPGGTTATLSELFDGRSDLILIHNMGRSCPYCTLWADEFNGVLAHLENRAAFVVTSPDSPQVQAEFAKSRGWRFKMVSIEGSEIAQELGFYSDDGDHRGYMPGVSTFQRDEEGRVTRVSRASFGPGDDYCGVWHLFALLKNGVDGWNPKFQY